MTDEINDYLSADHDRIDQFLQQSLLPSGEINFEAYYQFRQGLLRHIGIEEKILIPALQDRLDDELKITLDRIRLDHSAIVALLVPTPTKGIIAALRAILTGHNELEEKNGGFYERADAYDESAKPEIVEKIRNTPAVRSLPNNPDQRVLDATRRALERAGYDASLYF